MQNRLLYYNKDFHRFGFKESPKCSFCDEPNQSLEHLLATCQKVIEFREKIEQKILKQQVGQAGGIEHLLGPEEKTQSFIILEGNRYIYSRNHAGEELKINGFKAYLKSTQEVEEAIAKENDRLTKHLKKWDPINIML